MTVSLAARCWVRGQRRQTFVAPVLACCSLTLLLLYLLLLARNLRAEHSLGAFASRTDLMPTMAAARLVRAGQGAMLYDRETQRSAQLQLIREARHDYGPQLMAPYNHPPWEALLLAPLVRLPGWLVYLLWESALLVALCASGLLLTSYLELGRKLTGMLVLTSAAFFPLFQALVIGQTSAFVLLGFATVVVTMQRRAYRMAGLSLMLVALKPQLLPPILIVLLVRRRFSTLATFAVSQLALVLVAVAVLGISWPAKYISFLRLVARWHENTAIDPSTMPNLRGLMVSVLGGRDVPYAYLLVSAVTLAGLGLLVWRTREHSDGSPHTLTLWALTLVVSILTAFHVNAYDLALALVPASIVAISVGYGTAGPKTRVSWVALSTAGFAAGTMACLGLASVVPVTLVLTAGAALLALTVLRSADAADLRVD